ncbi:MAG: nucleotidyl transferase AbiEii/AbiGii toxin family protein [Methanobacteriota archaeon]
MTLYDKFETDTSSTYLKHIITKLEDPVCLLGGWAVYLTVNDLFSKDQGRNYLGSRDIDLGFYIPTSLSKTKLKDTTIGKSLTSLKTLGFNNIGFRYYKEIHYETRKELTPEEAKRTPTHDIFPMYIDPIVNEIHPFFKETFGFTPVDEPLLTFVFQHKKYRVELTEFNIPLWVPSPEILLATKIKSVPRRTKDEKLIKDICDIYALLWYSGKDYNTLQEETWKILNKNDKKQLQFFIQKEHDIFQKTQTALDIDTEIIKNLFKKFLK